MQLNVVRGRRQSGIARQPGFVLTAVCAATIGSLALGASRASEVEIDYWGEPGYTDPSHYTDEPGDPTQALANLLTSVEANEGAKETSGGRFLDKKAVEVNNVLPRRLQSSFNYPTNGYPSPMFGAQPWTQKLLMFEEFGPEKLDRTIDPGKNPFPRPQSPKAGPEASKLDGFLAQTSIYPYPMRESNTADRNPWQPDVELFLGRFLNNPPAEGRPPGEGWAHQRWNEFYPQSFFKTVQAGARTNGGVRDDKQLHQWKYGEFGPNGLYYSASGNKGTNVQIHPRMPVQKPESVWTFDGTLPPKLLMARYGQPILMRHYNALPIDPQSNRGFGLHTITTHEHNGHNPAESDGFANAFFFPGQYYDYRWPLQLAGYDTINTTASDRRAGFPCSPGETLWVNDATPGLKSCDNGIIKIRGDWRETMSTHWFHDHMLDFTAQNVYKGNAVMMNYYSALDRGNEGVNDGVNLRLPSGTALPWGNRDYDVNLVVADKAWDKEGQLWFNPFNVDGFIADRLLVNWQYAPTLDVRARRYRFRILNGSVSRYLSIGLVAECWGERTCELPGPSGSNKSYKRIPFHLVANDGNIMEHAVPFDGSMDLDADGQLDDHNAVLPTQGIAERMDIVVDFARHGLKAGDKLFFVNTMHHDTGIGAKTRIRLADIMAGKYKAVLKTNSNGSQQWDKGDPTVGPFLQLNVKAYGGTDQSMDPYQYEPAKPGVNGKPAKAAGQKMIPLWMDRSNPNEMARLAMARHRSFHFGRDAASDALPWTVKANGGSADNADPRRISAAPQLKQGQTGGGYAGEGDVEVWSISTGSGWSHPVHIHFEEGIILNRDGKAPPEWEKWARKDVYRVGSGDDSSGSVEVALHFREFAGTYVEHCHNTQHEDNAMLLRWDLEYPGQFQVMPTPLPTWDGVQYAPSVGIPTFRSGDGVGVK